MWSLEHFWNCTIRANLAHFSRRTVLPPRDYKNITQPDELKYTTIYGANYHRLHRLTFKRETNDDRISASIVAFARNCGPKKDLLTLIWFVNPQKICKFLEVPTPIVVTLSLMRFGLA